MRSVALGKPAALSLALVQLLISVGTSVSEADGPASYRQASGPVKSVPVIVYHRFSTGDVPANREWTPVETFKEQMALLERKGITPISMDLLVRFMNGAPVKLPRKPVVLTFDDGWRSQLEIVPILKKHKFAASFWVFPGKGIGDPYGDYFTWSELKSIADIPQFEVEAHSLSHPWKPDDNLVYWHEGLTPGRSREDVWQEISEPKRLLQTQLEKTVRFWAWPRGWYNEPMVSLVRSAGYEAALTVDPGANHRGDSPFHIKRLFVDGSCSMKEFEDLVTRFQYSPCKSGDMSVYSHLPPSPSATTVLAEKFRGD